jgi:hypothetical protein
LASKSIVELQPEISKIQLLFLLGLERIMGNNLLIGENYIKKVEFQIPLCSMLNLVAKKG